LENLSQAEPVAVLAAVRTNLLVAAGKNLLAAAAAAVLLHTGSLLLVHKKQKTAAVHKKSFQPYHHGNYFHLADVAAHYCCCRTVALGALELLDQREQIYQTPCLLLRAEREEHPIYAAHSKEGLHIAAAAADAVAVADDASE
jgi:hypothetical protein